MTCSDCHIVNEGKLVAGSTFVEGVIRKVELCAKHAATDDLLAACRTTMSILEYLITDCGEGKHRGGFCCYRNGGDKPARDALEAAIAKAEVKMQVQP